jgi:ribonuclease J
MDMARASQTGNDSLAFVPLGGLGEIGMNAALYGWGPPNRRKWILVDCGVTFAGPEAPGVDLILPDLAFIEENARDLVAIIITHAHEDHIGALAQAWPKLRAPVWCTPFAAGLLAARKLQEKGAPNIPLNIAVTGMPYQFGPFGIEFIKVAHSIPESCALAIRTPAGLIIHSGDWKLDASPPLGWLTDEARFRELGEEGVLALISDSTNVMRDGVSPSEAEVAATLTELIRTAPGRVAVTTFASNVARIKSVAEAAFANKREVVLVGRAMERVVEVARDLGMLDGLPEFRTADSYGYLPRDKVVAVLTGSQGEPRAALSRIAEDDHPEIALASGDRVIFSSRTIPGNEKAVGRILNALARDGVEIVTDRTHLVHVSGHPRQGEMKELYSWLKPQIAIPAHGENLHLAEHAKFAQAQGVPQVLVARNGDVVEIAAEGARKVDHVTAGRVYVDGELKVNALETTIAERRKLSFAGMISVAVAVDGRGQLAGDPEVALMGLPPRTRDNIPFEDVVISAVEQLLGNSNKARMRDPDGLEDAIVRAVRAAVSNQWGKKPAVHALVIEV